MKGRKVLIRTERAGVHFGTLQEKKGQEAHLLNTRRIWRWNGALSLSEIAAIGLKIEDSTISCAVEENILNGVIETILISEKSNLTSLCDQ